MSRVIIAWSEPGVRKDSSISFFAPSETFKKYYYYLYNCGSFHVTDQYDIRHEIGSYPLFIMVLDGCLHLDYDGSRYLVQGRDILLLDSGHAHHYWCEDSCSFIFFHFGGKDCDVMVRHLQQSNGSPIFQTKQDNEIYQIFLQTYHSLMYHNVKAERELSMMVYNILCLLESEEHVYPQDFERYSPPISEAVSYIQQHVHENLSLKQIADHVHLSPYYFTRLFKKETGYTPVNYLTNLKISLAQIMLRTSNSSVSQIADSLGYSSNTCFINAFRLRCHTTPAAYRKNLFQEERQGNTQTHNPKTIQEDPKLTASAPQFAQASLEQSGTLLEQPLANPDCPANPDPACRHSQSQANDLL